MRGKIFRILLISFVMSALLSSCAAFAAAPDPSGEKTHIGSYKETPDAFPKGNWKIALSNSMIGNTWRAQMMNVFNAYAKVLQDNGVIGSFYSTSAGQDPEAQVNEMRNIIAQGCDAIIIDAASMTALAPICEEAVDRGIVVVTFDNIVQSDLVYSVEFDPYEMGKRQGEWMLEKIGGKGNLLWIAGVEGSGSTVEHERGTMEVLKPYLDSGDVKILSKGYASWDEAKVSVLINNMLAAYKDQGIDGIINESQGEVAIFNALKENGIDPTKIPFTGEGLNAVARLIVKEGCDIFALTSSPSHVAEALRVAVKVLNGEKVAKQTMIPPPWFDKTNAANYYLDGVADSLIVPWTDEGNTYQIKAEDIIPKN
jgi:ribose transport system substrate-binding protein